MQYYFETIFPRIPKPVHDEWLPPCVAWVCLQKQSVTEGRVVLTEEALMNLTGDQLLSKHHCPLPLVSGRQTEQQLGRKAEGWALA